MCSDVNYTLTKIRRKKQSVNRKKHKDRVTDHRARLWSGWSLQLQYVYLPIYKWLISSNVSQEYLTTQISTQGNNYHYQTWTYNHTVFLIIFIYFFREKKGRVLTFGQIQQAWCFDITVSNINEPFSGGLLHLENYSWLQQAVCFPNIFFKLVKCAPGVSATCTQQCDLEIACPHSGKVRYTVVIWVLSPWILSHFARCFFFKKYIYLFGCFGS